MRRHRRRARASGPTRGTVRRSVRQVAVNYRSFTVLHLNFDVMRAYLLPLTQLSLFLFRYSRCVRPDAAVGGGRTCSLSLPRRVSIWPIMNAPSCPRGIARFTTAGSAWAPCVRPLVPDAGQGGRAGCYSDVLFNTNVMLGHPIPATPVFLLRLPSRWLLEISFEWHAKSCNCFSGRPPRRVAQTKAALRAEHSGAVIEVGGHFPDAGRACGHERAVKCTL